MSTILLKARLALELPFINSALERAVLAMPEPVQPVAKHIFNAGGKRLRPFLAVLSARICGYDAKHKSGLHDLAVTMEMLHAATLLHDDVLDNASVRRGKPAAHTVFDVTTTILAGDAMLACANAQVASFADCRLSSCFSEATSQTAAGEILEIANLRRVDTSSEKYADIVRGKTAWLIRASCELGAIFAGASQEHVSAIAEYGENLGMAFQMVDDALDFAPESETGKPTGGDLREGKMTLPLRLYRENLDQSARITFDAAFSSGKFSDMQVDEIAAEIRKNGFDMQTRKAADEYLETARMAAFKLADCQERDFLLQMADYVRDRKK